MPPATMGKTGLGVGVARQLGLTAWLVTTSQWIRKQRGHHGDPACDPLKLYLCGPTMPTVETDPVS